MLHVVLALARLSASMGASRAAPLCSLNGAYYAASKACRCDAAWGGADCELLALQPTPSGADFDERATLGLSTWGASIIEIPSAGGNESWHMWASEFLDGCAAGLHNLGACRIGFPPTEKNELVVLLFEMGCADRSTRPSQPEPNSPF